MATGELTGDDRQSSYGKDDYWFGSWIGLMDPTLALGVYFDVSDSDIRALDLIGEDLVSPPLPGAVWLLGSDSVRFWVLKRKFTA
jgi:hypothetical protein